jgi:hypothetical protein
MSVISSVFDFPAGITSSIWPTTFLSISRATNVHAYGVSLERRSSEYLIDTSFSLLIENEINVVRKGGLA